jgi:hypothetical protein
MNRFKAWKQPLASAWENDLYLESLTPRLGRATQVLSAAIVWRWFFLATSSGSSRSPGTYELCGARNNGGNRYSSGRFLHAPKPCF